MENKSQGDDLFDRLDVSISNVYVLLLFIRYKVIGEW